MDMDRDFFDKWVGQLITHYQQFLQQQQLPVETPDRLRQDVRDLLYGMGYCISQYDKETAQRWRYFMQQLAQFWLAEEYMARPQVSIAQFYLPKADVPFWKNLEESASHIVLEEFMPLEDRAEENVGYTANDTQIYPFLYVRQALFPSSKECLWELEYIDRDIPDRFDAVSAFVHWPQNPNRTYEILWYLQSATASLPQVPLSPGLSLHFPVRSYRYPGDEVPIPYHYNWNYLIPYPTALDFFLELRGLSREHFRWSDAENSWKAEIVWTNATRPVENFRDVPEGVLRLHSLPVFHWRKKPIQSVQTRQRIQILDLDTEKLIWLKTGSHSEMMPLPYYLRHSLDKRTLGYIKFPESRHVEVEVNPYFSGADDVNPIHIEALIIQDLAEEFSNYKGLSIMSLDRIPSCKAPQPFLEAEEEKIVAAHYHFFDTWRLSLRQWNAGNLKSLLQKYLKLCAMDGVEEISVDSVSMRLVPGKGMFPVIGVHIKVEKTKGKTWFVLRRFYEYLRERCQLGLIPYLEVHTPQETIPIFSTEI